MNNEPSKNKKTGLIMAVILVIVILAVIVVFAFKFVFNNENSSNELSNSSVDSVNSSNSSSNSSNSIIEDTKDFSFMYDFYATSEDYWNSKENKEYSTYNQLGYDNRRIFENFAGKKVGNVWSNLSHKTLGFSGIISASQEDNYTIDHYILNLENNKFLFAEKVEIINDQVPMSSSTLNLYVIGNDLKPYEISLSFEYLPEDITLEEDKWTINEFRDGEYFSINAYYKLNSKYCLQLDFPDVYPSDPTNEKYSSLIAYPYNESDIKELANKVTSLITLSKTSDIPEYREFTVSTDDINVADYATINLSTITYKSWYSGGSADKPPSVDVYTSNHEWIGISEFDTEENLKAQMSSSEMDLKEYSYNNATIYIAYNNDDASESLRGRYVSIILKDGDIWYSFTPRINSFDPNSGDTNDWIKKTLDGLVTFK